VLDFDGNAMLFSRARSLGAGYGEQNPGAASEALGYTFFNAKPAGYPTLPRVSSKESNSSSNYADGEWLEDSRGKWHMTR